MKRDTKNLLIALINNPTDLGIVHNDGWYRIPVRSAPPIVREGRIKHIAFYQSRVFKEEGYRIRWYGNVKRVTIVKRRELFPDLTFDPKAEDDYYRIELGEIKQLNQPVISHRGRRILFISTTLRHLFLAQELNDVFLESPIEERIWHAMKSRGMGAERQFLVEVGDNHFILDFALFTRIRSIDVECDGDTYHLDEQDVKRDKVRNNALESQGWAVLRYTTKQITDHLGDCIGEIRATINQYGGLEVLPDEGHYRYLGPDKGNQLRLFD